MIVEYEKENNMLREKNSELEKEEHESLEKLNLLSSQVEELELDIRLTNDKPSDHV